MFGVENNANNFGYSAGLLANTLANRPIRAALGTLYVTTDTLLLYRWTGSAWVEISGSGNAITGAFNGLQQQGTLIGLGGTLSEATEIFITDFPIDFNSETAPTSQFKVINSCAISEIAAFTSILSFNDGGVYIGNNELAGTIQAKSYDSGISTELRLNNNGGAILLGNGGFGMTFDDGTPLISTLWNNYAIGLRLNFDTKEFALGDFNNINNGTYLSIDETNQRFNFNGVGIISGSAGGNSGDHLEIFVNGTQYKINLLNP